MSVRRRTASMLFFVALAILNTAGVARADGLRWDITSFDVKIIVQADGTLDITERIVADFSREPHRGILRDIPYSYRRSGTSFRLRIDIQDITDDSGAAYPFVERRNDGKINLRIGDPNRPRREQVAYNIHYTVKRALLGFDTHDELYWNATGNAWPVFIENASCEITLPDQTFQSSEDVRTASFVGEYGSTAAGPAAEIGSDRRVRFRSNGNIMPWSGLTIVVGFPKGHVETPSAGTRVGWFIADNGILVAPVVVFSLLWLLWRFLGRDRGQPGSIAVQYQAPAGLTPVEVGAIIDERVDPRDITATIFDLAVRGYLKMQVPRSQYTGGPLTGKLQMNRTGKDASDLKPFERIILDALFESGESVKVESLEAKFHPTLMKVQSKVYRALDDAGYFAGHLAIVRTWWMGLAVLMVALTLIGGLLLLAADSFGPLSTIVAMAATIPLFPVFAWFMPRKTAKGRCALEQIKGLEEYITRAELPTLELAARQAQFEKLLPFAMALNLSDVWGRRFENLYNRPPEWFDTHGRNDVFTTSLLISHINKSSKSMTHALAMTPRTQMNLASGGKSSWSSGGFGGGSSGFSGGGFSGGGGGGGGGGAW